MIIDSGRPGTHIVAEQQPSGVGPTLWVGEVRDNTTGQVMQVATLIPTYTYSHRAPVMVPTTNSARRYNVTLDGLVATLRGLIADTRAAA